MDAFVKRLILCVQQYAAWASGHLLPLQHLLEVVATFQIQTAVKGYMLSVLK